MKKTRANRSLWVWIATLGLWWGAVFLAQSGAEERILSVVPSPSGLTVEARGVGVEEVLREMGEKVGFTVTINDAARPTVNISIRDATSEEILQQLLRGENYALVYRQAKGKSAQEKGEIDKILLLSPSGVTAANQTAESRGLEPEPPQTLLQSQTAVTGVAEGAQTARVVGQEERRLRGRGDEVPHDNMITIGDLLEDQAWQGMLTKKVLDSSNSEQYLAEGETETTNAGPVSGTTNLIGVGAAGQRNGQESFAVTTQLAQRNLVALVEGLATAASSSLNSQTNSGQGGH